MQKIAYAEGLEFLIYLLYIMANFHIMDSE